MPRETRPSKFSSPRSSTATRAPRSSGGMRAVYDFQEGTANEGSPVLTGFEDARPGWVRFLAGLGGVQGPDVSGMNAQLALAREGTTAQREMQTEKLRAELEQMRERAATEKALLEARLGGERTNALDVTAAQAKGRIREQRVIGKEGRITQNEKALLDREQEILRANTAAAAEKSKAIYAHLLKLGVDPESAEGRQLADSLVKQTLKNDLSTAVALERDPQAVEARRLRTIGADLKPYGEAQRLFQTPVSEDAAVGFFGPAGTGMPSGMLFGPRKGTPASLNTPGTPPSPARFEATPDMAAMRAGSTAMPVGRGRAFEDLNMRFVGGEQSAPTVAPRAVDAPPAPAEPYPTVADVGLVGVGSEALRRSGNVGFNFDNPMNPFAPNAPVNPINMLSGIIPGTEVNRAAAESLYKLLYGQKAVNTNSTAMPRLIQLR